MKIITRKEAKAQGLTRYFTGKPCKHGHIAERYSQEGQCSICKLERFRKSYKEIYARRREDHLTYYRNKHVDNPEANIERVREWRKANPEKRRAQIHTRRARESGGTLSPNIVSRLMKLQRGKCACCGQLLGDHYQLDHIMPLALGGTNTDNNIQLLLPRCNNQKHAKHPIEYMQSKGFLL